MNRAARPVLIALAVGVGAWAAVSTSGSGDAPERRAGAYTLVGLRPEQVRVLEIASGADQFRLGRQSDGGWHAHDGTPAASASLLTESANLLFPLRAYRRLQVDAADPEAGLGTPQFVVRVANRAGAQATVSIGAANFLGAGFYATHNADPRVYLVSKGTVDVLRSLTTGERYHSPRPAKETAIFDELEGRAPHEEEVSPWLRQALDEEGS